MDETNVSTSKLDPPHPNQLKQKAKVVLDQPCLLVVCEEHVTHLVK